jgi:protein-tyrosine kinase
MSLTPQRARNLLGQIVETRRLFAAVENLLDPVPSSSNCLAVTSTTQGEGKTTVLIGLAAVAAGQSSKPALIMDLNWYRPALHEYFGMERTFAVGDLVADDAIRNCARPSGVQGVDVITAPLPYETGGEPIADIGGLVRRLVRDAQAAYGIVLLDCHSVFPPNRHMVDPVVVSRLADLVLLVILAGVTPRQDVKRARMLLEMSGAKKLAVVLNQWKNPLG